MELELLEMTKNKTEGLRPSVLSRSEYAATIPINRRHLPFPRAITRSPKKKPNLILFPLIPVFLRMHKKRMTVRINSRPKSNQASPMIPVLARTPVFSNFSSSMIEAISACKISNCQLK